MYDMILGIKLDILSSTTYSIISITNLVKQAVLTQPSALLVGLPVASTTTSPIIDLITSNIPWASIHSGEMLDIYQRLFHIGADNARTCQYSEDIIT